MVAPIRILLITPPVLYARQMPIGTAYLAAFLKERGHEVQTWDLNTEIAVENDGDDFYWSETGHARRFYEENRALFDQWIDRIFSYDPHIIGFTAWSTTLFLALKLALHVKKRDPGRIIVFGGYQASCKSKDLFDYPQVDVVVCGEGEHTLLEIAEQFAATGTVTKVPGSIVRRDGCLVHGGPRREVEDLDAFPFPDFSGFDPAKYFFRQIPIVFNRGCCWSCVFCTMVRSWRRFRSRSAKNICREIRLRIDQYPDIRSFEVCDAAFNANVPLLMEVCDRVIAEGLRIKFGGMAQIRQEMTPAMLRKVREAGFYMCNYGLETGSQRVLDLMRKPFRVNDAERVIRDTREAGLGVVLNFVIGFPGETEKEFDETLEFIRRNRAFISAVAPGHECDIESTEIAPYPEKYGVVLPRDRADLRFWRTVDGTNTYEVRRRRKEAFDAFLKEQRIPVKCGVFDRQMDDATREPPGIEGSRE